MNAYLKWLKAFLAPEVKNIGSLVTSIHVKFLDFLFFDFLDWDKFLTVLSAIPLLTPLTTLLLSVLNTFGANISDDLVVFSIEVSGAAILLKPRMKRR